VLPFSFLQGAVWTAARRVINFGTYRDQVRRAAELRPGDRIVDVGCGTGEMAPIVPDGCQYLGVDLSPENISRATSWYGKPHRRFRVLDVTRERLPDGPYDVALMISVLHHMDDALAESILTQLAPQIRRRVVLVDLLALEGNPFQRFLVSMDQGRFPRSLWQQKALLEKHVRIDRADVFATRSGSATHSLFVCSPR
jgi:SAM-dependent methyltransferase